MITKFCFAIMKNTSNIFKRTKTFIFPSLSLSEVNLTSNRINKLYINGDKLHTLDNNILWIKMLIMSCDKHYYDEDDIQVGTPVECSVVINHEVELTQDEQNEARQSAIKQLHDEAYTAMKKKPVRSKKVTEDKQLSLF